MKYFSLLILFVSTCFAADPTIGTRTVWPKDTAVFTQGVVPMAGASGQGTPSPINITSTTNATLTGNILANGAVFTNALTVPNGGTGYNGVATNGTVLVGNGTIYTPAANTDLFVDTTNHRVGIGTATPGMFLDIVGTTEQLRLRYDPAHYASQTVNSSGNLTIAPSGGATTISSALTIPATFKFSGDTGDIQISGSGNTASFIQYDFPDISTASAQVRLFRTTSTSGNRLFTIYKGDGSATTSMLFNAFGDSYVNALTGNFGVGTNNPTSSLSVSGNAFTTGTATIGSTLTIQAGMVVPSTITTPGTTGNQTINKMAGRVNIAAGGTTLTVTDNLVTTNSIILCTIATDDATATLKNCVPGSGSFVIKLTAAATAETAISFLVVN